MLFRLDEADFGVDDLAIDNGYKGGLLHHVGIESREVIEVFVRGQCEGVVFSRTNGDDFELASWIARSSTNQAGMTLCSFAGDQRHIGCAALFDRSANRSATMFVSYGQRLIARQDLHGSFERFAVVDPDGIEVVARRRRVGPNGEGPRVKITDDEFAIAIRLAGQVSHQLDCGQLRRRRALGNLDGDSTANRKRSHEADLDVVEIVAIDFYLLTRP